MSPARHHHALPEGYQLHWYEIDSILGQGGFGITYLARDTNLDQLVAIKEFLPSDLAVRTQDSTVQPLSSGHTDTYGWGLNRFLTEARTLAKFRHPNIVRVTSVFEANNTAYMVMEYERGESFENMLKFKQVGGEAALKKILLALLDGLELVHGAGFIHRDIKPSNVYLREDGVPVLLDFGSARLALGVETRTLTSLVSPGYAPFEQYNATRDSDKQGPWTDIYALGATMYRAVTGHGPIDAAARANLLLDEQRDPFQPCAQMALENYAPEFLQAIDRALAFPPGDRPQSVASWRHLVMAGAVDGDAETVAVGVNPASVEQVDFALDQGPVAAPPPDTGTRTIPVAALETAAAPAPAPAVTASGRGWFVATSLVVVAGIAVVAWLSLRVPAPEDAVPQVSTAPAPPPAAPVANAGVEAPAASAAPSADDAAPQAGENAPAATETQQPLAALTAVPVSAPAPEKPTSHTATEAAPVTETKPPQPAAAAAPVTAELTPQETTAAAPAPAKTAAQKAAAPAPAKKPPEKVAAAAPTKTPSKKPARPRTREEKVAALLVTAEQHLRAERLTTPKRRNALSDYLTVLAMDTDNDTARQGVELIAGKYVSKARAATGARDFDKANDYLGQARFVLDAMRLRKWPPETYDALFARYREANRLLAAAR